MIKNYFFPLYKFGAAMATGLIALSAGAVSPLPLP